VLLVFLAVRQKHWPLAVAGGVMFGAACFSNYLALFTTLAAFLWLLLTRPRLLPAALAGFLPFLPACAWFYLAQRHARAGQFEPFSPPHAFLLLAKDSGATIFGGLPLYAGHFGTAVTLALVILFATCIGFAIHRRHTHAMLFALAALATPCGLFALGLAFGNTPIEIRYLAFSTPYLALLFAPALPRPLLALMLAVQACAIIGLGWAQATMQPQASAAGQAATHNALVLLPYGNDGVGIPGSFIASAPGNMRILLLHPGTKIPGEPTVLAALAIDNESRAVVAAAGCPSGLVVMCTPR